MLVYLTVLKLTGHAIGQRPLLTLGVLLVVVGMQLLSLGLISELITSHHEERDAERGLVERTWTRSSAEPRVRVVYFGTYERDYPRNAQVISCLRSAGVDVVERHAGVWERRRHKWSLGAGSIWRVHARSCGSSHGGAAASFDAVIVGYPGHFDMTAARRVARESARSCSTHSSRSGTPSSATAVASPGLGRLGRAAPGRPDRVPQGGSRRRRHRAACALLPRDVRAGARPGGRLPGRRRGSPLPPGWQPAGPFHALFVGKLIPLHGLEVILEAARLAPEVPFRLVGSGQLDSLLESRPANVEWVRWVEYELLPRELQTAGCALGIFSANDKAARVIPNKAFQAIACGTPLVTARHAGRA